MSRPKPRIDIIRRVGKPIVFDDRKRIIIEKAYGHVLTSKQWKQITTITSILTIYTPGISAASRSRTMLSKFRKLEEAAKSLRAEFSKTPIEGIFTPAEIYYAFFTARRCAPGQGEHFQFLEEILGAVVKFSEFAILQLQNYEQPNAWFSLSESDVWNIWVNALTKLMRENGLPYKIRKDKDKNKNDVQSSFVMFVWELQKFIPKECRKFTHSEYALAQGINRARRRSK